MNTFNLSARARTIVENFNQINPSMVFKEGSVLGTTSPNQDVFGFGVIQESIPSKFAIYDLRKFLGILGLYEDPKLEVENKTITITGSGRKFVYTLAAENQILAPNTDSHDKLVKAAEDTKISSFNLSSKELVSLKKNAAIADLPDIVISSDGKKVSIKSLNSKNPTSDTYSTDVADADKKFNLIFDRNKINNLLDEDFEVTVAKGLVRFKSNDLEYYIAPEDGSKYE